MDNPKQAKTDGTRTFFYRSTIPPGLALLLLAPLLLVFLSVAAAVLIGGTLAALVLPLFLGRRARREADDRSITLGPDQYAHIDADQPQLPRQ